LPLSPSSIIWHRLVGSDARRLGGNRRPDRKQWQPTAGFRASVICGLTAEDRNQLQNPTLISSMGLLLTLRLLKQWHISDCV